MFSLAVRVYDNLKGASDSDVSELKALLSLYPQINEGSPHLLRLCDKLYDADPTMLTFGVNTSGHMDGSDFYLTIYSDDKVAISDGCDDNDVLISPTFSES